MVHKLSEPVKTLAQLETLSFELVHIANIGMVTGSAAFSLYSTGELQGMINMEQIHQVNVINEPIVDKHIDRDLSSALNLHEKLLVLRGLVTSAADYMTQNRHLVRADAYQAVHKANEEVYKEVLKSTKQLMKAFAQQEKEVPSE